MNNTALVAPFCQPASSADWGASRLATGAARCRLECETGGEGPLELQLRLAQPSRLPT